MPMEKRLCFEDFSDAFYSYLKKRNLSDHTVTAYLGALRLYFSMYRDVTPEHFRSFREELIRKCPAATVNQRLCAVNHFIRFLPEQDEDLYRELENMKLPAVKLQQTSFQNTVISNRDYRRLLKKLRQTDNELWYFIVRFLAATGVRVGELLQIKAEHLHCGFLDLYSKGGKVRRIYIPSVLCREALEWCEKTGRTSGFLFLNRQGRPITPRGVHSQLKTYARRFGIDPATVYPHAFRHRFAINFLRRCHDISLLADLMGHESIETTRIYLTKPSREQQKLLDDLVTW